MLVIAQLLGQLIQRVKAIALQMLNVGRALLERILQSGKLYSVQNTLQSKPALIPQQQKKERVLQTTQGRRLGKESLIAHPQPDKALTLDGSKYKTPARQTSKPAKQEQSQLKKDAKRTTLEQSQKQDKARAQTLTGNQYGVSGKSKAPVSKTLQPAKLVAKAVPKRAKRTSAAKSQK